MTLRRRVRGETSRRAAVGLVIAAWALGAGCAGADGARTDGGDAPGAVFLKDPQGVWVLGETPDALSAAITGAYVSVEVSDVPGFAELGADDGELYGIEAGTGVRRDGTDSALEVELVTTTGHTLRIARVHGPLTGFAVPIGVPSLMHGVDLYSYEIEIVADDGSTEPLCRYESSLITGLGSNRAWAIAGRWTRPFGLVEAHGYDPDPDHITFACPGDGVIPKCLAWGYAPWDAGDDYFEACVRMARADYCGRDLSHTIEGTVIDVFDFYGTAPTAPSWATLDWADHASSINQPADPVTIPPSALPPIPDADEDQSVTMYLAAAWRPEGSLCVGKLRWQMMPEGLCDPQVLSGSGGGGIDPGGDIGGGGIDGSTELALPGAHTCESLSPDYLSANGALVFDSSGFLERGLYVWSNGSSSLTTSRGYCRGSDGEEPETGYSSATYLGFVLARDADELVVLKSWRNKLSGRYLTTTDALGTGWTEAGVEGYIIADDDGDAGTTPDAVTELADRTGGQFVGAPLYQYSKSKFWGGFDYYTGLSRPKGWFLAGSRLLGWIMKPAGAPSFTCSL